MSTLTSFKGGLEVVTPSPSGPGGLAINDNFKRLGRLAVELAAGDPDASDDSDHDFAAGSLWYNTSSGLAWICSDAAVGAAVWKQLSPARLSPGVVDLGAVSGTVTLDASAGTQFRLVMSGDVAFAAPNDPTDGQTIQMRLKMGGAGGYAASFAAGPGGFVKPDGWDGTILGGYGQITFISAQYDLAADAWYLFMPVKAGYPTPTSIPGLVMWLDASQITGVSNGTALATWPDASGNGHDATQSTSGYRPTYYSSTSPINGLPYVLFDDVDDGMVTSLSLSGNYTIMFVERPHTVTSTHRSVQSGSVNCEITTTRDPNTAYVQGALSSNALSGTDARVATLINKNPGLFYVNGVDRTTATNTGHA